MWSIVTAPRIRKGSIHPWKNLALIAEIERSDVGRVERDGNNVALLALLKLAGALDISAAELMTVAKL